MTKLFSIIAVAIMATSFVSCGQSAEEKAKIEEQAKLTADSISAALEASLAGAMNEATADTTVTSIETTTTVIEAKH